MANTKELLGKVISDKMQKTRVVKVLLQSKHPKYGRIIRKYNKFKVHDEKNISRVGDTVRIRQVRPLSKDKRFLLLGVTKKTELSAEIKEVE